MSTSRLLITSLLVSSSLVMASCGNKDKSAAEKITAPAVQTIIGDKLDNRDFDKLLKVETRKTPEAEIKRALSKAGLVDSGKGALSWAAQTEKDGAYTYTDLTAKGENGEDLKVQELKLTGVHMSGDYATFDRLDLKGLTILDEDKTANIAHLSLANPSPKFGAAILNMIENMETLEDLDMDVDMGGDTPTFGALMMDGLKITDTDAVITLGNLGWGEDTTSGKGLFLLEGLNIDAETDDGKALPINLTLGSISAKGLDMAYFRGIGNKAIADGQHKMGTQNFGFNPFAKTFDSFALTDFDMSVDTLNLTSDGIVGKASLKGDITTITQSINPFSLSFSGEAQDPEIAKVQQSLSSAGFEKLVFSGASKTRLDKGADSFEVTDSFFRVDDAFNMTFNYAGTGLDAVTAQLNQSENANQLSEAELDTLLSKIALSRFEMTLTDNSIVEKVLNIASKQQGTTPGLIKMQAKSGLMLMGLAAQTEAQGEALTSLASAMGSFLDTGGTLKLSLNPSEPIAVSRLKNAKPETLDPSEFGFSVQHEK